MSDNVEKIRFLDAGGQEMFSICHGSSTIGTINITSGPANSSMVAEGVRRTVIEYGETLRQLSNE